MDTAVYLLATFGDRFAPAPIATEAASGPTADRAMRSPVKRKPVRRAAKLTTIAKVSER